MPTSMRDTIDTYESFLQRALQGTFKHPRMILLGTLVATVNTGSVFFHMYQFATIIAPFEGLPVEIFSALPPIAWLGASNLFANTSLLSIAITVIMSILFFLAGTMAQKIIIEQAYSAKPVKTRLSKAQFGLHSVWVHLLYINAIYMLGLLLAFTVGGSLLAAIPEASAIAFNLTTVALYIALILFVFLWNVMTLLTIMHIVHEGEPTSQAMQNAFTHVTKKPLQVIEVSMIQLATELLFTIFGVFIVGAGALGAGLLTTLLSVTESTLIVRTGLIFLGSLVALSLILFAGLITSFGYHLWTEYFKGQQHITIRSIMLHIGRGITSLFRKS